MNFDHLMSAPIPIPTTPPDSPMCPLPCNPPKVLRNPVLGSGAGPLTTMTGHPSMLFPDTELSSLRICASSLKKESLEPDTFRDMSVSPPPGLSEASDRLSFPLPVDQESIWSLPEVPRTRPVTTVANRNPEIQTLDSILQRLETLQHARNEEDREREMISMQLLRLSQTVAPSMMSPVNTPMLSSSSTKDSLLCNPLFLPAPDLANLARSSRNPKSSGITDQRARERATQSMKRLETKPTL